MQANPEISELVEAAKDLSRRYYALTGRPLGVTGEIAEYEAVRLLGLDLAPVRQAGWDASRLARDGVVETFQIKGRWMVRGVQAGARLGKIDLTKPFDAVLLVLLDASLNAISIHRADRAAIVEALGRPGSTSRNVRGQLSVNAFLSISKPAWLPTLALHVVKGGAQE